MQVQCRRKGTQGNRTVRINRCRAESNSEAAKQPSRQSTIKKQQPINNERIKSIHQSKIKHQTILNLQIRISESDTTYIV